MKSPINDRKKENKNVKYVLFSWNVQNVSNARNNSGTNYYIKLEWN